MEDRQIKLLSEKELLAELAECISLEGEAKTRGKPLRDELLRRQCETGETTIEHDGWQSTLSKEPISAAWVERQFGFPKEELPPEVFELVTDMKFSAEKALKWLVDQGFEVKPSYGIKVGKKKLVKPIN
jgi:hypothetical protein